MIWNTIISRTIILKAFPLFIGAALMSSCNWRNRYFDSMKVISEQIRLHPGDQSKWNELVSYTKSGDAWARYYAYCFLAELIADKVGNQKESCVMLFISGTSDPEQHIRHRCVLAIKDAGSDAVNTASSRLLEILQLRIEDDVTWSAAEALGEVSDKKIAFNVVNELVLAAAEPLSPGTDPNAPRLRSFALESAKVLTINHLHDVENAKLFDPLLDHVDDAFRPAVEDAIREIRNSIRH